ncbi:tyrosyl-tRNA synthetase [Pantoea dispersa]|uniref:Tyrosine--tRNA ligase n=2 Tax=Pantoea dispersa TaxID=59814 RepID=A0A8E1S0P0_9GAMM|nr:tyrosyl-tRNA synthetase [Pantoea dispersa]KTS22247.1 tyrosyl-tRNA synthetase [Pantoea dispersa]KTS57187.1 tyrosyl-tRNA synthetase [Pantoea dispersa]KTS68505.1 tyrosyl-tRNA synthetase [Pantoea dispersa]
MNVVAEMLCKNVAIMEPGNGLQTKLLTAHKEGRSLVIKLGFDPTAPDLHLGHAVVLRKLRQFQDAGHRIVIIIGDFTASIGDPTGRNKLRPPLEERDILRNSQTYIDQLGKILDITRIEVRRNSEWFNAMQFADIIKLVSRVTLAQMMQREDFKQRFQSSSPVHLHELLYPVLQGYDSVMIHSDIELGGTDQLFNNLVGRSLQESFGMPGQAVITLPLLPGLDGQDKMSKSKNNYIALMDSPEDMFGKVMSLPDKLVPEYFHLATNLPEETVHRLLAERNNGVHPMALKMTLAQTLVSEYHNVESAERAKAHFQRVFQEHRPAEEDHEPLDIGDKPDISLLDLCSLAIHDVSRSELRRLIRSGAVRINQEKQTDEHFTFVPAKGTLLWVGKRHRYIIR